MKKMFVVEFVDAKKQPIFVSGKGRQSVSMKIAGVRVSKATEIKSIIALESDKSKVIK
jgi:hypothetical protein